LVAVKFVVGIFVWYVIVMLQQTQHTVRPIPEKVHLTSPHLTEPHQESPFRLSGPIALPFSPASRSPPVLSNLI